MDFGVGRIVELLGDPRIRCFLGELLGPRDCTLHALRPWREHELGPQHGQEDAPFQGHRLGHGQDDLVALGRGDKGQRDASIAAGRLDDHGVFFQHAPLLCIVNHGHADAVLDAAERIEEFTLEQDGGGRTRRDAIEADERSASDGFDDVVVNTA
jgi:hypothetical protein